MSSLGFQERGYDLYGRVVVWIWTWCSISFAVLAGEEEYNVCDCIQAKYAQRQFRRIITA